jgi:hypothetical protein
LTLNGIRLSLKRADSLRSTSFITVRWLFRSGWTEVFERNWCRDRLVCPAVV